jgi:hypothetical protein
MYDSGVDGRLIRSFSDTEITSLREVFDNAKPWPHLIIDDVVNPSSARSIGDFPPRDWPHWSGFVDKYQHGKRYCDDIAIMPAPLAQIIRECSEPRFLKFLEAVTGLDKLIPDPHLDGGGLHSTGEGGVLFPHTDFHIHLRLGVYRYLNILIYLTPEWDSSNGGELGLYRKGQSKPDQLIVPAFGRMVIFKTDDQSVHGFTNPVGPKARRNSIALYYYRSQESADFGGDTSTHWQSHGSRKGLRGLRLAAYHALLFGSRGLSKLAHMANPNMRPR